MPGRVSRKPLRNCAAARDPRLWSSPPSARNQATATTTAHWALPLNPSLTSLRPPPPHQNNHTAPAHSGGIKTLSGKACSKADPACVRCYVNKKAKGATPTCTRCAPGAELDDTDSCVCPAGWALKGSQPVVAPTHSSNKKQKPIAQRGCSPCPVDTYAAEAQPVTSARCTKCADGETTDGATGSTSCEPACTPYATCAALPTPQECGTADNGCGTGTLTCPSCPASNSACGVANTCLCAAGYYPTSASPNLACTACGLGYYCPGGTSDPSDASARVECALGTDTGSVTTASTSTDCVVSNCDPCGAGSPTTYFTRANDRKVWISPNLSPPSATAGTATLLCTMPTNTPEFTASDSELNDIAVTSTGKLLVAGRPTGSATTGFILLVDPAAQTPGGTCTYEKLLDITPAVAGLGAGAKSNLFYATGGTRVYTYVLSESNGQASLTPSGSVDVSGTISSIGASDITAVPGNPNLVYFTAGSGNGYSMALDANGNPTGAPTQLSTGGAGASVPAAWCTATTAYVAPGSADSAYIFPSTLGTFTRTTEETSMSGSGISGAANVPSCGGSNR